MSKYIEFRKELENNKAERACVIPLHELPNKVDPYKDCYRSLFFYDEEILKHVTDKGSVSGFRGKAGIDRLVWDFDHTDLEVARRDSLELIRRLEQKYKIQKNEIGVFFSGRKGFAVEIKCNDIKGLDGVLDENIPIFVKKLCIKIAGDLESFDRVIYNHNRLYRIAGTLHQKEVPLEKGSIRLFKTSISYEMLQTSSIENIKKYAMTLRVPESFDKISDVSKINAEVKYIIDHIDEISRSLPEVPKVQAGMQTDDSLAPKNYKTCIWRLCQGSYTVGRDNALLRIADHEKKLGMPPSVIKNKLRGVLELMNEADPKKTKLDPMGEQDLERIVNQAMTREYDFGCYDPVLDSQCSKKCFLAHRKFNESDAETVTLLDAYVQSKSFYQKYYENIVPTGLKAIDDTMPLFNGTLNLIVGKPGCHPRGTEVIMYDGTLKKVEEVQLGDELMGPDSTVRIVEQLCRNRQEMVKIIPNKGKSFVVNLDHELSLINVDTKKTILISLRNYFKKNKTFKKRHLLYRTGVEFDAKFQKPLEIDPYILGLWLGDGTSSSNRFYTMDKEVISSLENYANSLGLELRKVDSMSKKSGKASCYAIASKNSKRNTNSFLQALRSLNLLNNKHIPHKYLTSSKENRLALLAGLIDSDGYKALSSKSKKQWGSSYEYTTKLKKLSTDILFLVRSLGFAAYDNPSIKSAIYKDGTKSIAKSYHRISISGETHTIPVRIPRKKCNTRMSNKNVLHVGFTASKLPVDNYYGFTLNKDHLYLLDDFTVTKNTGKTSLMLNIMKNASQNNIPALFFSLDMSQEMLIQRCAPILLADKHGQPFISGTDFMQAHARNDAKLMDEALKAFESVSKNVLISSKRSMKVSEIADEIDRQEARWGRKVKLVIVDYVQLLRSDKEGFANHEFNSEALAEVAKNKKVCLLGLSQAVGGYNDPDILAKGSRAWEEQTSTQLNCFRPFKEKQPEYDYVMSLRMAKNRLGSTDIVDLFFNGPSGFVRDLKEHEDLEIKALKERLGHDQG